MAQRPENFAVSPAAAYADQDSLSDVLQAIHLHGGDVTCFTGVGRQAFAEGARMVHLVEHGVIRVEIAGAQTVEISDGGMVLLARGAAHVIKADAGTQWVTGEFLVENPVAAPLLGVLPPAIVITCDAAGLPWLPLSLQLMVSEVGEPRPGSRVMVSRLLDLLFIRALRTWAAVSGRDADPGWLTAAMDPVLGPVLAAIHRAPEREWPVDELARLAALSRSAFAGRFTALVGEPPGAYVLRRRLDHAAHLLRSTAEPVGRVAATAGYTSEAAFTRAFARAYGAAPRAWRRAR
ncbi:cupin domain-containing protein [Amycolatopsis sp. cg5]|uniref:AraC family transcriptional regulator n=1 Tax=Amycolatopsis sp. cg5 TaxID=3238802 RepID=UPI0035260C69